MARGTLAQAANTLLPSRFAQLVVQARLVWPWLLHANMQQPCHELADPNCRGGSSTHTCCSTVQGSARVFTSHLHFHTPITHPLFHTVTPCCCYPVACFTRLSCV